MNTGTNGQAPTTRALRATRQRAAVSSMLDRLDDFRSAQVSTAGPSISTVWPQRRQTRWWWCSAEAQRR